MGKGARNKKRKRKEKNADEKRSKDNAKNKNDREEHKEVGRSRAEEENELEPLQPEGSDSLSKKEKRKKKKKKTSEGLTESNEMSAMAQGQSLSSNKDGTYQHDTGESDMNSGGTSHSNQQGTSQESGPRTTDTKLKGKGSNRVTESTTTFNNVQSKKTDSVPQTPPLEDFLVQPYKLYLFSNKNVSSAVSKVPQLKFTSLNEQQIERCIEWIIERSVDSFVTEEQGLYLCVLLDHVTATISTPTHVVLPKNETTKRACDFLLHSLVRLSKRRFIPSPNVINSLEAIASVLVANCSFQPGWLTFAAYFYPFFGMKRVLEKNIVSPKYEKDEYMQLVNLLLSHYILDIRKVSEQDKPDYKLFLKRIFKLAPDDGVLFQLFAHERIHWFFYDRRDRESFCIEFWKNSGRTGSGDSVNISEKLQQLSHLRNNIRGQLSGVVYGYLLEFFNSFEKPTDKDLENFIDLLLSLKLYQDQLHRIIMLISTSKTVAYQGLLLTLLNDPNKRFHSQWDKVPHSAKLEICVTWVKTRVCTNEVVQINVTKAYQAAQDILSRPLIHAALGARVLWSIHEWLIDNVQPDEIFHELKDMEKFTCYEVRQSCLDLIKDVLHNQLHVVNDKRLLSQFCNSSFYSRVLALVLDVLKIPDQKKINAESVFQTMLPWCEIWTTLLRAQGFIKSDDKFQKGKEIWQELDACIATGNVSRAFLGVLQKYQSKVSFLLANLTMSDLHTQENVKRFSDRITELIEIEKKASENMSLLESAIKFAQNLSWKSGEITLKFNKKRESLRDVKMNELNDKYWRPYLPLLKLSSYLQPVMSSFSFIKVSQDCLSETNSENHHTVFSNAEHEMTSLHWLLNLLSTVALPRFEAEWNRVLNNPDSQTVETIETLLGDPTNLKNEEKLVDEFEILTKYFNRSLPRNVKDYSEDYMKYQRILTQVDNLVRLLKTLAIMKPENDLVSTLTTFKQRFKYDGTIAMKDLHEPLNKVERMISQYMEKIDDVIVELGQSGELIDFLKEIVKEDVRLLIDAVEEHSDHNVNESLVSMFIQVHGFLAPVIYQCQVGFGPELILMEVVRHCESQKDMSVKIRQCSENVHSLKGLYRNVANREEMTKETISNCLSKGEFDISLKDNGICKITMRYKKDGKNLTEKSISELHDLRSRAHLIISSDKKPQVLTPDYVKEDVNYSEFIEQVNIASEIEEAIVHLRSSGYIKYQNSCQWSTIKRKKQLQDLNDNLREELNEWEKSLHDGRQQYYFLNYFWSDQLCVLYNFLTDVNFTHRDFHDVLTLIHFVDPSFDELRLREYGKTHATHSPNNSQNIPQEIISMIGNALEEILTNTRPNLRTIVDDMMPSFSPTECNASVTKGELYVVVLDEGSPLTTNVMLALYENTTNGYPEPYQVIFCGPQTAWEEIQLFLQRCLTQTTYLPRESLFCLANVELLTNEVQFELVDFIKKQEDDLDYQLAIICRGGDHHHIVEEFSKFRHSISGMSHSEVSQRLRSTWPDVKVVTSTLPGLGKTEFIRQDVLKKRMNVVTFPISGQLNQSKIIQRLKQLGLKHFHCLHFDIGEVDDPFLLDIFLFQLIVTGMVSCGTQLYSLRNTHVYIEIANSLNDQLRESLVITQCFNCVKLQWNNFRDLEVSSKITSDIQVVCQYLDALDQNRLETSDIRFSGQQKKNPLSATRCHELLRKYYSTEVDTTFTGLNTFLGLLADQLRKFSRSAFFEIENLKLMLEHKASGVRNNLLKALLDVSKDFAARSLKTYSSSNSRQLLSCTSAQHMVERVEGMIQWDDSNHLLIVFHGGNSQTIAAFYREKDLVPQNVSDLLKSQIVKDTKELDDFKEMSHQELHGKLERIARIKPPVDEMQDTVEKEFSGYALTPDNMLKMILIILRVRANVPVIIMGETGCGKTSLVQYLATTCQIPFSIYNFHAGRTEEEVQAFIEKEDTEARLKDAHQRWVFLDEINTCHHLGLINEIMCHHTLYGRPLSRKLVLLAACNPYKLRPKENATTAGLEGKNVIDEYSQLVYRVHQLPEAMVDYVWDYGSLTPDDEKAYIKRMVRKLPTEYQNVLVDLLAASQTFIRESEHNPFCVSLRDVRRCILLVEWFNDTMEQRNGKKESVPISHHLRKYQDLAQRYDKQPVVKSIVLALAHCYLSRLQTAALRKGYTERMTQLYHFTPSQEEFTAIIRMEQEDYLDEMELPPGTARNAALRENVFVMLVSILNRIPVFVVGKPGCSKSLSIQLIRSNLRGKDSKKPFFKTLPQVYVVSYQGSESSTSEGINKVFEIASNYKEHNKDANVLPVVLLDEVGLAENSPNNPLKVLHSILEPGKGQLPDVAVVGISNWALDAAKMNRAIHLSRPEPTVKDLEETAISLYHADSKSRKEVPVLNCLANAYHEYQSRQGHANFHGLRDYYSLVKSLDADSCNDMNQIGIALKRNFGGIPVESSKVQEVFIENLKSYVPTRDNDPIIPVTTLIQENLDDRKARHLMLITKGDSAIGILNQILPQSGKKIITIFGSRFEEDMSDNYNYRMLSRIILCMERDCILILRDLECIYGSLYDMLNQNYTVVGKRKNCRVALGAYSNPMCYVNDGFRCIVLVDYDQVNYSDPPFLNRFEKQLLRFSDVLDERQQNVIAELQVWVRQMSNVKDLSEQFKESDMFIGFHDDTLPSLVLLHSNDTVESNEVIVKKCKDDLMSIATPDGVLRTKKCERLKEEPREVKKLTDEYFKKPIHNGLASFITNLIRDQEFADSSGDEIGSKTIVMTYATVHTDLKKCLEEITYQTERLGAYKSEKQLEDRIHNFFSSDKELLVLQCKPELDGEHMLLARSIIEEERNSYKKLFRESDSTKARKHVCMLVHVHRTDKENPVNWQFNFLSGWKQVFLDTLEAPAIAVNEIRSKSVDSLLSSSVWSFKTFAEKCILWCFNCIKYTKNRRQPQSIFKISNNLLKSEKVHTAIKKLVLQHVSQISDEMSEHVEEEWPVKVACDKELLINSSTLSSAMEHYLSCLIKKPLAKIVFFLERENAWPPHLLPLDTNEDMVSEYEDVWCDFLMDASIFNILEIPECQGSDGYSVGGVRLDLKVPFSQVIFHKNDAAKSLVLKERSQVMENKLNLDDEGELTQNAKLQQLQCYSEILAEFTPSISKLPESFLSTYMADILQIASADFNTKIGCQQCVSFSACFFLSFAKQWGSIRDSLQFYTILHLFVWTSREQINDILELVHWCQNFVDKEHLDDLTEKFFSENQAILPFVDNEFIDERFDAMRKKELSENDSDDSDDESSDGDSSDSEESESESSDSESSSSEEVEDAEKQDDDEQDAEDQESFEDLFVTLICEKMFPSKTAVTKSGGLESWIRNSPQLLSLALKVSNQTPAIHFLRLCVDYAKLFVQPAVMSPSYIYPLHEISKGLKPGYLDAENSLGIIRETIIEPVEDRLRGDEEKHGVLQKFLSQFYCRCIDTNVETESTRPIIEHIFSLGENVLLMTPVMYRFLFAEEFQSPGIFFKIIINQSIDEDSCLKDIDDVFRKRFANGLIHHDSYLAVMICDLIHSIQAFDKHFNIEQLKSSDSEILRCFRCATNVLTGSQDNFGLVLLSSVAFLRAFCTMLSKIPGILISETPYSQVMGEINSLLAAGGARRSTLQIFLLKQLYGAGMTMFDLSKLCHDSEKLPVLKKLFEQSKIVNKVELVSVFRLPEYEEVKDSYWNLTQQNESDMLTILTNCKNSANHRLALLGILINTFYVKKAVGNLSDKEERLAKWFSDKSDDLPPPFKEILLKIIGRESFKHHGLQISLGSKTNEIETALLILHIASVVASCVEGDMSPLFQYFFKPGKCHGTRILAHGDEKRLGVFDQFALSSCPATCTCGLRVTFRSDQEQNLCPYCGEIVRADSEDTTSDPRKIYSFEATSKEWTKCTENLSAPVFRALHLVVYVCLYSGVATGISSNTDVSSLLRATEESITGVTCENSLDFCFDLIKDDLECLKTILSCDSRTAVDVMHLVVEECTELIQGKIISNDISSTHEEWVQWENAFSSIAEDILPRALGSARALKETKNFGEETEKNSLIENQIQELDEYPSDREQQNKELKRLFRVTKQPSFTELRSIILNSSNDFPVLALLLSKFDELPYLACLFPLLRWTRVVSSSLTHRISRQEAEMKYNIDDFIKGHVLQQGRTNEECARLRELFDDFKDAWNKMRGFVNQNLGPATNEMPFLSEYDYIGYCLTDGDLSIYLCTAIKILQSLQNNILDEMILASIRTRHPALSFLEKNETSCAIMSVSLQEAKKREIINFDWTDEFLKYAQNPEYGFGEDICYDFEQMETELANEIVFGKCYLTESMDTQFIFSKELFHSSAKMLTKIRELIRPQSQSLPEEIRSGLSSLKEGRIQDAQKLLQHIEVLIYLLTMKSIPVKKAHEMTVETCSEQWKSKFSNPFPLDLLPEPRGSIKLTHIAALYEALEDLLADGTIEGLPRQFRKEMTEETKSILTGLVDSRNGSLKLKQFLKVLRRFVFRYLSAEKFRPEPYTALHSCLSEPSLWSPDEPPEPDVIPKEMTLENIYAIIKHLDKEQRGYSSAWTQSQRSQLGTGKQRKRLVLAANFKR